MQRQAENQYSFFFTAILNLDYYCGLWNRYGNSIITHKLIRSNRVVA